MQLWRGEKTTTITTQNLNGKVVEIDLRSTWRTRRKVHTQTGRLSQWVVVHGKTGVWLSDAFSGCWIYMTVGIALCCVLLECPWCWCWGVRGSSWVRECEHGITVVAGVFHRIYKLLSTVYFLSPLSNRNGVMRARELRSLLLRSQSQQKLMFFL